MSRFTRAALALFVLCPAVAFAAEPPAAAASAAKSEAEIAVRLEGDWPLVVRAEIAQLFRADAIDAFLYKLTGERDADAPLAADAIRKAFANTGAKALYLCPHFQQGVTFAGFIPDCYFDKNLVSILQATGILPPRSMKIDSAPLDGGVLFGDARTIAAARAAWAAPVDRERASLFTEAFAATRGAALQIVLVPTEDNRRVVQGLMPTLPPQLGGGPTAPLVRGLRWAALGVTLHPELALQFTMQATDAEAAAAMQQTLETALSKGCELAVAQKLLSKERAAALCAALKLRSEGTQLLLSLKESDQSSEAPLQIVRESIAAAQSAARHAADTNSLKMLGVALHNFQDAYKHFPNNVRDREGKPLLSWRVQLLPFVGEEKLYREFHLDEPWDSAHNKPLVEKMPSVFRSTFSKGPPSTGRTSFCGVVGEQTFFPPSGEGLAVKEFTDGLSTTVALVAVDDEHAPLWTKPEDLPYNADNPANGWARYKGKFIVLLADGAVRALPLPADPKKLIPILLRNEGSPPAILSGR